MLVCGQVTAFQVLPDFPGSGLVKEAFVLVCCWDQFDLVEAAYPFIPPLPECFCLKEPAFTLIIPLDWVLKREVWVL